VHGVAADVGPQAEKTTVPVGDPWAAVPVTVAVSTAPLPRVTLALLTAVFTVGATRRVALAALTPAVTPTTRATIDTTVRPWKTNRRISVFLSASRSLPAHADFQTPIRRHRTPSPTLPWWIS
jgi:hypothetical protein